MARTDVDVLLRLKKEGGSGNTRELRTQAVDHLIDRDALRDGREKCNQHARVDRAVAYIRGHIRNRGIGKHNLAVPQFFGSHGVKRNILRRLHASHDAQGVLLREKALRDVVVEQSAQAYGAERHR